MCLFGLVATSEARRQRRVKDASPFANTDAEYISEEERVTIKLGLTATEGKLRNTNQNESFKLEPKKMDRSSHIPKLNEYFQVGSVFETNAGKRLHSEVQKLMATEKANLKKEHEKKLMQKKLKENPQINLTNRYSNMIYSGPMYVGSTQQKQSLVYDTGSDWITLESSECKSCFGDNFDASVSTSWAPADESNETELEYGSAWLEGITGTDDICLDSE